MFPGINFVILSLFASPQFCEYTSTMSNVQRFSRAPRELTGGFNYSWLTGKNYARLHGWSHLCEQSSDDASSLNGLLLHESKRDRNGVTRNSDRHTYIHTYGGRMCEPILFLFFRPTHLAEKMIFMSESCAFVFERKRQVARRLALLRLYFSRTFNAECICQILKFTYFCNIRIAYIKD